MKTCAVNGCDAKFDLQEHHIDPVVYDPSGRRIKNVKMNRIFDPKKVLGECTFVEVFSYMFTLGCITEKDTITLCTYHHNVMHGIVRFNKAEHSAMVKAGIEKARSNGVRIGRPGVTVLNDAVKNQIKEDYLIDIPIRKLVKKYRIGTNTVYSVLAEVFGEEGFNSLRQLKKDQKQKKVEV